MSKLFADGSLNSIETIVAITVTTIVAGIIMTATVSLLLWRRLHVKDSAAIETFLTPSSQTFRVACRPPPVSPGRPSIPRADLVSCRPRPRFWEWAPGGSSSASVRSWNARQWYGPEAEARLVPPDVRAGYGSHWDWKAAGSPSSRPSRSGAENWYRPAYHSGSSAPAIPNFYYSPPRACDPRVIPAFYVT